MERVILDTLKEFSKKLPVYILSGKLTLASFIALAIGTAIYGYVMLHDKVDNWKKRLKWTSMWLSMVILGRLLAYKEFSQIEEGETSSILFVLGLLPLSVAHIVISFRASFVHDGCLVNYILVVVIILGIWVSFQSVLILIGALN